MKNDPAENVSPRPESRYQRRLDEIRAGMESNGDGTTTLHNGDLSWLLNEVLLLSEPSPSPSPQARPPVALPCDYCGQDLTSSPIAIGSSSAVWNCAKSPTGQHGFTMKVGGPVTTTVQCLPLGVTAAHHEVPPNLSRPPVQRETPRPPLDSFGWPRNCEKCGRLIPETCIRVCWQDENGVAKVRHLSDCLAPERNECNENPAAERETQPPLPDFWGWYGMLSVLVHRGGIKWGSIGLPTKEEAMAVIGKFEAFCKSQDTQAAPSPLPQPEVLKGVAMFTKQQIEAGLALAKKWYEGKSINDIHADQLIECIEKAGQ